MHMSAAQAVMASFIMAVVLIPFIVGLTAVAIYHSNTRRQNAVFWAGTALLIIDVTVCVFLGVVFFSGDSPYKDGMVVFIMMYLGAPAMLGMIYSLFVD